MASREAAESGKVAGEKTQTVGAAYGSQSATKAPERVLHQGPTRATTLPDDGALRKTYPVASGVMDYFPDALVAVANVSWRGNEQHNPGQVLHWARGKSTDEADTLLRHFLQRGSRDSDGMRHSAKMAWRALALLQKEIEADMGTAGCANPGGACCEVAKDSPQTKARENIRQERVTESQLRATEFEEGTYMLTIERERY